MRFTLIVVTTLSVVLPCKGMSRFSRVAQMSIRSSLCSRTFSHLIKSGNVHGVEVALQRGENLDAGEKTAFEVAVENDQPVIAGLLVEEGAVDINKGSPETGKTPLHLAAEKNGVALCKLLLDQGALIDAQDAKGRTALHYAHKQGNDRLCDLLLKHGANKNLLDHSGYRADEPDCDPCKVVLMSAGGLAILFALVAVIPCGVC